MRIDQSRNGGNPVGIDGLIRFVLQANADGANQAVFNINGIRLAQRIFQFAGNQCADIFDHDRRHARTIAKRPIKAKRLDAKTMMSALTTLMNTDANCPEGRRVAIFRRRS